MITLQEEKVTNPLFSEIDRLLHMHYDEIAENKDKIKLNVDHKFYFQGSKAGAIHVVTARKEGELIGYFVSIVRPHPHYKDHIFAMNDVLYVHPDYRKTSVSVRMFQYAEKALKAMGVSKIVLHMKTKHPFVSFAEKLGYTLEEYNFAKYIGE